MAFTVEDMEEAMDYFQKKGIVFTTEQPNTAIDGGKLLFFYGPDREYLQLLQKIVPLPFG